MKSSLILILCIIYTGILSGQTPQAFNYQGIARDLNGAPLANRNIGLKITIRSGFANGTEAYAEEHHIQTNKLGLFNIEIGNGTSQTGTFSSIGWGLSRHFVQIEIDENGGNNFQNLGTSELLSVPYALYAAHSGDNFWKMNPLGIDYSGGHVGIGTANPIQKLAISGADDDGDSRIYLLAHNKSLSNRSTSLIGVSAGNDDSRTYLNHYSETYNSEGNKFTDFGQVHSTGAGLILSASSAGGVLKFLTGVDGANHVPERMRITADGNVGIGTEIPSQKLSISGNNDDGDGRIYLLARNTSLSDRSSSLIGVSAGNDNSRTYLNQYAETYNFEGTKYTDFGQVHSTGAGLILSASSANGILKFLAGVDGLNHSQERMRITAAGAVGIGTENPVSKLQVKNGDVYLEDINSGVIMKSPDGNCWRMTISNSGTITSAAVPCPN